MSFYWTTTEITDKNITIENGGHYEALNRDINPSTVKISHDIIPSSDISELCVSGSPEASLFAKIQSSQKEGKYYIYKTDERPDTELSNISLDFGVLEEYRYNMDKRDSVNLDLFKTVTAPLQPIKDIKLAYEISEKNQVNERYAESIKSHLKALIKGRAYPTNALEKAKIEEFEDYANAYGMDTAKEIFGGFPDGYDEN
jgi:predicted ribonuclease toxin of YeeF-YezG toxin-antitoxin module